MKIAIVVGARPEFIQCNLILKEINKKGKGILIHTGQHYDYKMSKLFFDQLHISEPECYIGVGSGNPGEQTGKMLIGIEKVLLNERPDLVLVSGDTNSTLSGALVAVKLHIPVGHMESGLRSFDKTMPEEINRIIVDHCSSILFAPTKTAVKTLKKEGIIENVFLTGDVMYDVLIENKKIAGKSKILDDLKVKPKEYLLMTIHRQSNTDNTENLKNILSAISDVETTIIFPVHPRTKKIIEKNHFDEIIWKNENIKIIDPVGYIDFLCLEMNAKKILTDSGGIQKEAYLLKVPCITLRENTEWIETIEDGWNILAGTNKKKIIEYIKEFEPNKEQKKPFGDGSASKKICKIINNIVLKNIKI